MKKGAFVVACISVLSFTACAKNMRAEGYVVGEVRLPTEKVLGVEIEWANGEIEVEESADGELRVYEETPSGNGENGVCYFVENGVVKVRACSKNRREKEGKNLQVEIPKGLDLEIDGLGVEVVVGVVELGAFSVETRTGDISAERLVCRRVEVETTDGDVRIGELLAKSCSIESKLGEITVGLTGGMDCEIETERGNINLYPHGICLQVDFQTRSGKLITEKAYEKTGKRYTFDCPLVGTRQNGKLCSMEVETLSGNLSVY